MIYDLRFAASRCSAGGVEDFGQFNGLIVQFCQSFWREKQGKLADFYPKGGLIRLFENGRNLIDEVGAGFPTQGSPIIRRDRTATASNLICNRSSRHCS